MAEGLYSGLPQSLAPLYDNHPSLPAQRLETSLCPECVSAQQDGHLATISPWTNIVLVG